MTRHAKSYRHTLAVLSALIIFCAAGSFSSCSSQKKSSDQEGSQDTREVVDDAGRRLIIPVRVERVVSLAPNLTEIVYAVGAGNRLVGNTILCNFPPEARDVAKVGDTMQPSLERIVALRPQLVLVSTASQLEAFTRQMEEQKIPLYITDPHNLEDVFRNIQTLGDILGERERAAQVVIDLRARAKTIEEAVKSRQPVTVFYQVSREPLYTAGHDSYITDLIKRAGGKSVTAEVTGAWPRYSDESALASQPEAIIMASFDSMSEQEQIAASLKTSPAAKNGRVFGINGDYLSRPGPRLIEGLEEMARVLHPDAFNKR